MADGGHGICSPALMPSVLAHLCPVPTRVRSTVLSRQGAGPALPSTIASEGQGQLFCSHVLRASLPLATSLLCSLHQWQMSYGIRSPTHIHWLVLLSQSSYSSFESLCIRLPLSFCSMRESQASMFSSSMYLQVQQEDKTGHFV